MVIPSKAKAVEKKLLQDEQLLPKIGILLEKMGLVGEHHNNQ